MVITTQPVLVKSTVVASGGLETKATSVTRLLKLAQHMREGDYIFHFPRLGLVLVVKYCYIVSALRVIAFGVQAIGICCLRVLNSKPLCIRVIGILFVLTKSIVIEGEYTVLRSLPSHDAIGKPVERGNLASAAKLLRLIEEVKHLLLSGRFFDALSIHRIGQDSEITPWLAAIRERTAPLKQFSIRYPHAGFQRFVRGTEQAAAIAGGSIY